MDMGHGFEKVRSQKQSNGGSRKNRDPFGMGGGFGGGGMGGGFD